MGIMRWFLCGIASVLVLTGLTGCAELSEVLGPRHPWNEHVVPLAKASGWRAELRPIGSPYAVLEIAPDKAAAERAWRENVPDTLPGRTGVPDKPGVYRELSEVNFDEYALVVWSSGESGTCPEWIADLYTTDDGTVAVELGATSSTGVCTRDYRAYRMMLAVDRDRLPDRTDLPTDKIIGVPDGVVRVYPDNP